MTGRLQLDLISKVCPLLCFRPILLVTEIKSNTMSTVIIT